MTCSSCRMHQDDQYLVNRPPGQSARPRLTLPRASAESERKGLVIRSVSDIATQVVTAVATSISTLCAVALTLFATARSERRRVRDAELHRNHQERQEAAVTFLATYDAYYFACRNYQAGQIDALPIEIRPTQLTAGARVELFFPSDVRAAARDAMNCLNSLWDAVQGERSGATLVKGASVADLLTEAAAARTAFLQRARFAIGES